MLTNDQLRDILRKAAYGNITQWCERNGCNGGNISNMISGKKPISKSVAEKLGYVQRWVKK